MARASELQASPLFRTAGTRRRKGGISKPGERVERSLQAAEFAERKSQAVLTWVRTKFPQDERCRYGALLDRSGQPSISPTCCSISLALTDRRFARTTILAVQ